MTYQLRRLSLAAVNIDGVLLNDTFSPVIHSFLTRRGAVYTPDVERAVLSQPRRIAGEQMARLTGSDATSEDMLSAYFEERDSYLREHPVQLTEGAVGLLRRLRGLGLRTVCYGGLSKEHFDRYLGEYAELFDGPGYVCTNDFRPGIREITGEVFGLTPGEALFIDDVARVAEAARELGVPFIGHPSSFEHSFQHRLMAEAGVRHLVSSLDAIDEELVRVLDAEAVSETVWRTHEGEGAPR